ncbi:MAG: ribosome maturation factor RimM, partial [Clostridia bacterium]|nr:ribosome maturation factor RimM [Clostridia bacterium]
LLKAQGIKGEVKLAWFGDDSSMRKTVKQMYIGTKTYAVQKIRCDGAFCYVLLDGVADRNAAEALRNWTVYADKENVNVPKNRYFIADLLDCVVFTSDGKAVGTVKDILQYGSADVFVCDDNGVSVSFPFLNDLVLSVNIASKNIVVDARRFDEVAVYED